MFVGDYQNNGQCIWYGQCGLNDKGKYVNCEYNGTAKLLNDSASLQTFKEVCGMIYNGKFYLMNCFLFVEVTFRTG